MTEVEAPSPTAPAPPRGRLPSPGCLLAATVVVSVALAVGWFVWGMCERQARADYLTQLGGSFVPDPAWPVWLHDFVEVRLGAEYATGFIDIKILDMHGTRISDAGMPTLSGLTNLRRLWLNDTEITDAGINQLSQLTNLEELHLSNTRITDDGLQSLKDLNRLAVLDLANTQVTDAGMQNLTSLANLQWLDLRNTQITDAGLRQLETLVQIRYVVLDGTQVTIDGVDDLRKELPGCLIRLSRHSSDSIVPQR